MNPPQQVNHPVLSQLFPHIWPLKNGLLEMGVPSKGLLRPKDSAEYQALLQKSIICSSKQKLSGEFSKGVSSQGEVRPVRIS